MTIKNKVLILLTTVLLSAGCAQSTTTSDTVASNVPLITISPNAPTNTANGSVTTLPENIQIPIVFLDPAILTKLNIQSGHAVERGSIESVFQELNTLCTQAVAPLRALMAKYESLSFVPPGNMYADAFRSGKGCETFSAQEWTDFYALELAGWLYR